MQLLKRDFQLGRAYEGACTNDSSPSAMANHVIAYHPDKVPEGHRTTRTGAVASAPEDAALMRRWAREMSFRELHPDRMIDSAGLRCALGSRATGLFGRKRLRAHQDRLLTDIEAHVKSSVTQAKDAGCVFAIQGDTWKPKMRRRPHTTTVFC